MKKTFKIIGIITIIAVIIFIITISITEFPKKMYGIKVLSSNTTQSNILNGTIYNYYWVKTMDNYNYFYCHGDRIVFKPEYSESDFGYSIYFKEDINIENYKNKTIMIKGDVVFEIIEREMECDTVSQMPIGVCDKSNFTTFHCSKIINAEVIESK
jgi:hypothetical protein